MADKSTTRLSIADGRWSATAARSVPMATSLSPSGNDADATGGVFCAVDAIDRVTRCYMFVSPSRQAG
ncbi:MULTISPECIES: hypothetical protein [unclassified Sphingomonas]|uniref:hypothetical protein n=1 Tax=unclassified Sphingomonas TaxID=196159 RepID=UPI0038795F1F